MMTDVEILDKLEDSTKNAVQTQAETLHSILQHQGGVCYLQRYLSGYDTPIDAATFKRAVPLSCYDNYADYINRLANGANEDDQPLLSVDPLICFFYSSGTSSMKPKLIPVFESTPSRAASSLAHQGSVAILRRLFPPRNDVNRILCFIYADTITTTKGGFKVMAASAYPLHSNSKAIWDRLRYISSPPEVILGSNLEQQMYCHLLCGLRNADTIDGIVAPYAVGLIRVISLLDSKWEQLCDDLEKGYPCSDITEVKMRESVVEVLDGPLPDLSNRIRLICGTNDWGGIMGKLWPNARYVKCVTTGSMRQYYSKVKFYAGDVSVLCGDYFASECVAAMNLDIAQPPERTCFAMVPNAAYFEFLPFDFNKSEVMGQETVDFTGVEVGKMYEVVVTTYRGLYRYRLGDIVKVVGFHNSSPNVEFVMRAPKSSLEIINERNLMSAMESFQFELKDVGAEIVEFASFMNSESRPKKLKIYVEVRAGFVFLQEEKLQESVVLLKRCCLSLEDGLGSIYKVERERGEISPLTVSIVKSGSFDRLLQVAIENGTPPSQYKPPKIIRNIAIVELLEGCVLVTASSDRLDDYKN